jgi:hypothetical protein
MIVQSIFVLMDGGADMTTLDEKKYAIHPGYVTSKNDGEQHFISYGQLINLYGLKEKDCIVWDLEIPETWRGRNHKDYVHLYPKYNGRYILPSSR